MSTKTGGIVLALMVAVIVGLLTMDYWYPKNLKQADSAGSLQVVRPLAGGLSQAANKDSSQECANTLQDQSAGEGQRNLARLNKDQQSVQSENATSLKEKNSKEYFLLKSQFCFEDVRFEVFDGEKIGFIYAPINNVSVRLKTNKNGYTSVKFLADVDFLQEKDSAIILVPSKEDVEVWEDWLERKKQEHVEYQKQ